MLSYNEVQKNSLRFLIGSVSALVFCKFLTVSISVNMGLGDSYRFPPATITQSILFAAQQGAILFENLLTPLAVLWLGATIGCLHQQRPNVDLGREENTLRIDD
ncbi:hypothetical protein HW509_01275 [Asaia spathodeae]|uniref:hypothetical protein n=1 Tax=Asaia spathodeae TaxID=657016 RepID=UPI002FC2EDF9